MSLNFVFFFGWFENILFILVKVFNIYVFIGKDIYVFIGKDCYGVDDFVFIIWLDMWYLKFLFWFIDVLILFILNFEVIFLIRFF